MKLGRLRRLSAGIGQPIGCRRKLRGLAGDALQPLAQPLIALAVFLDQTGDAAGAVEAEAVDGGPLYLMQAEHFHAHISRPHRLLEHREPVLLFARSDATNLDCARPLARLESEADIEIIGATRGVAPVNLDCSDGALLAQIELEPVGHRAREKAHQASCLGNVKQITLGIMMYMQDYDECLPQSYYYWHGGPGLCIWTLYTYPYVKNWQLYICPSAGRSSYTYSHWFDPPTIPSTKLDYGINCHLASPFHNQGHPLAMVKYPSQTILVADSGRAEETTTYAAAQSPEVSLPSALPPLA